MNEKNERWKLMVKREDYEPFQKMMTMFQVVLSLIITSICPETETRERNKEREEIC